MIMISFPFVKACTNSVKTLFSLLCTVFMNNFFPRMSFSYRVMLLCWQNCPEDRPTFQELYLILHEIFNTKAVRE